MNSPRQPGDLPTAPTAADREALRAAVDAFDANPSYATLCAFEDAAIACGRNFASTPRRLREWTTRYLADHIGDADEMVGARGEGG